MLPTRGPPTSLPKTSMPPCRKRWHTAVPTACPPWKFHSLATWPFSPTRPVPWWVYGSRWHTRDFNWLARVARRHGTSSIPGSMTGLWTSTPRCWGGTPRQRAIPRISGMHVHSMTVRRSRVSTMRRWANGHFPRGCRRIGRCISVPTTPTPARPRPLNWVVWCSLRLRTPHMAGWH
ncbi:Uncharacterised protein [Mycobacteroides abscessus subsp. abscessus]|nr:Uncharacterised protein [Mycobacteroides abscessus subsp. abscessus]